MPPIEPNTPPADDPGFELVEDAPRRIPVARPVYDDYDPRLAWWVRGALVVMGLAFLTIFGVAAWLNPYDADGNARSMATHTQLGLPPCNMVTLIGKPCPACGMTTSFALLIHGDVPASLRANWAGTVLALTWLALIPWAAASAVRGKYLFIRSGEALATVIVVVMLVLMLGRWGAVLLS